MEQSGSGQPTTTGAANVSSSELVLTGKTVAEKYKQYLEHVSKEIHDEKMKRFVQHTQSIETYQNYNGSKSKPRPQREQKRVDTGLS